MAERLTSLAVDEELPHSERAALAQHHQSCASCREFADSVDVLRQRLRVQAVDHVPDVTDRVRTQLQSARAPSAPSRFRRTDLLRVAAAFAGAFLVTALVVAQLAPAPVLAAGLGERVLVAQSRVHAMSAELTVIERGWHPDVPERAYDGTLQYEAPESMRLQLYDRTDYPSPEWTPNHTDWFVDEDVASSSGLRPCPAALQPSCSASGARVDRWRGRAPFDEAVPAPLDSVVPATSFALTGPVGDLGRRTIAGMRAFGVRVSAAQAEPLLEGVLLAGNWREVHHSDTTDVWLEERSLTPLAVEVRPAAGTERRLWAVARGLPDPPDEPYLLITFRNVRLNAAAAGVQLPPRETTAGSTDGGFVDAPHSMPFVTPAWLPPGLRQHRAGTRGDVAITAWSDGRAWLLVRSTRAWRASRLFGDLGQLVRPVELEEGTLYLGGGGTKLGLHTDNLDIAVSGSLDEQTLIRVARSLGVRGQTVPDEWAEAATATAAEAARKLPGLLVARDLPGFAEPAVRIEGSSAVSSYVGAGTRGFLLTQQSGKALPPPFDAVVLGVVVRGHDGRFTPARGAMEWVEGGRVVTLESQSLGLGELLGIAEVLGPAP